MNKGLVFILIFLFVSLSFVSAANSDGLLQIWRNASSGANVSWVDNNGNWYMRGDINFSGSLFGDGSGLTGIEGSFNSAAWNRSGTNVVLHYTGDNVGIGTTSPGALLHLNQSTGLARQIIESGNNAAYLRLSPVSGSDAAINLYNGSSGKWLIGNDASDSDKFKINTGDESTGLASNNKFTIDSSGNVGIGTTTPAELLTIKGTGANAFLQFNTSSSYYNGIKFGDDSDSVAGRIQYYHGDDSMQFDTSGSFTFEGGNVGIGTTSPFSNVVASTGDFSGSGLHIESSSGAGRGIIEGDPAVLILADKGAGSVANERIGGLALDAVGSDGFMKFLAYNDSASISVDNILVMDLGTGNVGIGTTTPSAKLEINGGGLIVSGSPGSQGSGNRYISGAGTSTDWYFNVPTGGDFYFAESESVSMFIKEGGNVGIGTTSPVNALDVVAGSSGIPLGIYRNSNTVGYGSVIQFNLKNSASAYTDYARISGGIANNTASSEGGFLAFTTKKSGSLTEQMRIDNQGNVGIGTTTPSQTLDVRGQGNFSGTVYINNGTDISTFVTSGAGNSSSWNRSGTKVILHHEGDSVGIGTDSPSAKLEVDSGSLGSGLTLQLKNDNGPKLRFYDDGESEYWDVSAEGTPDLVFTFNGTKESMRLQGVTGYLGVGLANPQRVFHANGTSRFSMENDASAVPTIVEFYTSGGSEFLGQIHGQVFNGNPTLGISAAATNNLALSTNNSWASPQLFISTAGNVGIGTTNPRVELEVNGSENANPVPSGALLLLQGKTNVNNRWGMRIDTSGDLNFDTVFGGINYTRVFFDRDGKVGINNVAPNATLHVAGDINVTSGNDVCIDGGNCLSTVIAEAGNVSGSGTLNYIPKWTASSVLGDSAISDDGTTITVNL